MKCENFTVFVEQFVRYNVLLRCSVCVFANFAAGTRGSVFHDEKRGFGGALSSCDFADEWDRMSKEYREVMMMELDAGQDKYRNGACIKVIGVGGGGGNAVNSMVEAGVEGVQLIVANTDKQALAHSLAEIRIQIGEQRTHGLGAGSQPSVGQEAAQESASIIQEQLKGANMVFVTAGMGGGTGTGAAPVIAGIARQLGALTVGVVTKPFKFEGARRRRYAEEGIENLKRNCDTVITIPNQRLLQTSGEQMTMVDAFKYADSVLVNAVRSISELITKPAEVNLDFADVRTVMSNQGMALMGTGVGEGPNRATDAAEAAISSPLLDDISLEGATHVLLNFTTPRSVTLFEIAEAASLIEEAAADDALVIWGHAISEEDTEEVKVTLIATGFGNGESMQEEMPSYGNAMQSGHFGAYSQGRVQSQPRMAPAAMPGMGGQSGLYAAQAAPVYQDTLSSGTMDLAQKMKEYDERSDNLYAVTAPQRPATNYAPAAPKANDYPVPDVFAQVQRPAADNVRSAEAPVVQPSVQETPKSSATQSALDDLLDEDSLSTPAFLRRSGKQKYFLD